MVTSHSVPQQHPCPFTQVHNRFLAVEMGVEGFAGEEGGVTGVLFQTLDNHSCQRGGGKPQVW